MVQKRKVQGLISGRSLSRVVFLLLLLFEGPLFFFLIFYSCIYLAALGLSCGIQDLRSLLRHMNFLVQACELLAVVCAILFPDQGWELGTLNWKCKVLATGPLGNKV